MTSGTVNVYLHDAHGNKNSMFNLMVHSIQISIPCNQWGRIKEQNGKLEVDLQFSISNVRQLVVMEGVYHIHYIRAQEVLYYPFIVSIRRMRRTSFYGVCTRYQGDCKGANSISQFI